MPNWSVRRSIASARRLVQLAQEHGASLDACLQGTGIGSDQLEGPDVDILPEQELRLIRNVLQTLPQAGALGIEAGLRYRVSDAGIWGYALISSRTLREAFQLTLRYLDLSSVLGDLFFEESEGTGRVRFDYQSIPEELREFVMERDFGVLAAVQRQIVGVPLPARHVQLAYPRPPHAARLEAHFGLVPEYDAPETWLVVDSAIFDRPLPQANEAMLKLCEAEARKLLEQRKLRTGFSAKVRDIILRQPSQGPDMDAVAAELCVTARTLRRYLAEEGTTFRALRDEVLLMLAEELLDTAHMKLDEVAERLGYSDSAAFSHAFKRWKGVPPRAQRRA